MDKIILVHYVNVAGMTRNRAYQILGEYDTMLKRASEAEGDVSHYIVPSTGDSRIECVNPKLVSEDEKAKIYATLDSYKAKVTQFLAEAEAFAAKVKADADRAEASEKAFKEAAKKEMGLFRTRISAFDKKIRSIFVKR